VRFVSPHFRLRRLRHISQQAAVCLLGAALSGAPVWAQGADTHAPGYASSLPTLGDPAQGSLSSAQEKRLGEIIMREMRQEPDFLHDSLLRDYLQAIVDRLTPAARRTAEMEAPAHFHVFLLRDRSFNAFALPGGWIGVHTGLIIDAQSHDQAAAVFAHEMSHITQRHIAQRLAQMGRDRLLSIGSLLLAIAAASAGQDQAAQGLAMGGQAAAIDNALRFSRSNERDADRTGEEVLAESGYPPQAMASMLLRLQNLSRLDDSDVLAFLQTHPLTSERIADAQARGGNQPLPPDHDLMFCLMHARARALTPSTRDAMQREEKRFSADKAAFSAQQAAIDYGQAVLLQRLGRFDAAAAARSRGRKLRPPAPRPPSICHSICCRPNCCWSANPRRQPMQPVRFTANFRIPPPLGICWRAACWPCPIKNRRESFCASRPWRIRKTSCCGKTWPAPRPPWAPLRRNTAPRPRLTPCKEKPKRPSNNCTLRSARRGRITSRRRSSTRVCAPSNKRTRSRCRSTRRCRSECRARAVESSAQG